MSLAPLIYPEIRREGGPVDSLWDRKQEEETRRPSTKSMVTCVLRDTHKSGGILRPVRPSPLKGVKLFELVCQRKYMQTCKKMRRLGCVNSPPPRSEGSRRRDSRNLSFVVSCMYVGSELTVRSFFRLREIKLKDLYEEQ